MAILYKYTAKDNTGKAANGELYAANHAAAVAELNQRGLTPITLMQAKDNQSNKPAGLNALFSTLPFTNRVKTQDKVIFSRQLATMVAAGVPIARSLNILQEQTESPKVKQMAADLAKQVEGGQSLAKAMASHPDIISHVYVSMVRAGEAGGILDDVLDRLAEQEEKDAEIRSKVKSALMYPAVVSVVTVVAFFFLMIVIVPQLSSVFSDMGAQLPVYTQVMLAISAFLVNFWYVILGLVIVGVVFFRLWHSTPNGRRIIDKALLKSPIFGKIIVKVNTARFARTFGSLMFAGTPLLDALDVTKSALNNSIFQREINAIAIEVKNGRALSTELHESKNFPPIVGQMVAIGEETGKLNEILVKLATFYEREVDDVVSGLTSVIEPILILVLGGMVGFIAVSVIGPISSLSQAI
jgi:type IV pilus assembly protein PilC